MDVRGPARSPNAAELRRRRMGVARAARAELSGDLPAMSGSLRAFVVNFDQVLDWIPRHADP